MFRRRMRIATTHRMNSNGMASLAGALVLLCSCGGGGGGSGGGGTQPPPTPGAPPKVTGVVLRGSFTASGAATVLVDGVAAVVEGGTWRRELAIPDGGKLVVVQLRVDGDLVAERVLAIGQPQVAP